MRDIKDDPMYAALHNYAAAPAKNEIDWSECGLAKLRSPSRRKVHVTRQKQHLRPLR